MFSLAGQANPSGLVSAAQNSTPANASTSRATYSCPLLFRSAKPAARPLSKCSSLVTPLIPHTRQPVKGLVGVLCASAAALDAPPAESDQGEDVPEVSTSAQEQEESNPKAQPAQELVLESPFRVGDVVTGKVVRSESRGARIELIDFPRISGFMPVKEGPFPIRSNLMGAERRDQYRTNNLAMQAPHLNVGTVRQFEVVRVPEDMAYNGRGPLLSAGRVDRDLLWKRMCQLHEVALEDKETLKVTVYDVNHGGLLAWCGGLKGFIPLSQLPKAEGEWWTDDSMREAFIGKEVEVAIIDNQQSQNKLILSMTVAQQYTGMRKLQVGSLVWGTVRRVEEFGVFIGVDDTKVSGLLHVSNISRSRVQHISEVFEVGERVRALVVSMDAGYKNISLSTAHMEVESGDMLVNKQLVYEKADATIEGLYKAWEQGEAQAKAAQSSAPVNELVWDE